MGKVVKGRRGSNLKIGTVYIRVSAVDETDRIIDDIKRSCSDYLKDLGDKNKMSYQIEDYIIDCVSLLEDPVSGYQRMIESIKGGKIDFIITTEIIRLCKSTADFLNLAKLCNENKVDVIITGLDFNSSLFEGKSLEILASLSQLQLDM